MNDKVKSLFFSQYLGQKVSSYSNDQKPHILSYTELDTATINQRVLLLRDINHVSEAELINVVAILNPNSTLDIESNQAIKAMHIGIAKRMLAEGEAFYNRTFIQFSIVTDYLRSISILLPFTHLSETNQPITLTPAEIINLGWAKLQSNEQ